jgi:hypothetical protein
MLDAWAFAVVELNLTTDQFLDIAPVAWTALVEAWKTKMKRQGFKFDSDTPADRANSQRELSAALMGLGFKPRPKPTA